MNCFDKVIIFGKDGRCITPAFLNMTPEEIGDIKRKERGNRYRDILAIIKRREKKD